ncbi:MAG: ribosomal protein S18-alanine N-acetyltransferase [Glaciecola sp.]|jgi:[ribosomal protein S18]-alanine N-acetyltransferase|nr:ribosomal protein S18-alanine N-acetyltransferase [Glaciecola sp.]MDG1468047.1 ribosomal protein S18-alanine N-acetyltransferase [Glaciecola sp.]MDG1921544.1 ribosomal protein S18-alanine N-acetyltransferase [Glaciecola sp.]
MTTISQLTIEHWQSAYAIMQQTQPDTWSIDTFTQSLSPPNLAMQLILDQQCIGFYIIQVLRTTSFTEWNLEEIAVAPRFQGRGYGRELINELVKQAKLLHVDDIFLEVRASNQRAIHLYIDSGFKQIDVRKNYYPIIPQNLASTNELTTDPTSLATHEDALILRWQRYA